MGIFRRRQAEPALAQRSVGWTDSSRPPSWGEVTTGAGFSPVPVTLERAFGLPAVSAAIRLVAETLAALPCNVFSGEGADKRLARDSWQWQLLHELPGMGDFTPFDFFSDVAGSIEASGNAFIHKVKAGGQVIALLVIDAGRVEVRREAGSKYFLVRNAQGRQERRTANDILHIRGFTMTGSDMGLSPIAVHRQKIGAVAAAEEFTGRFFSQGMHMGHAVKFPHKVTDDEQKTFLRRWRRNHGGLQNAHLPIMLTDGAELEKLGMSLSDAQFVEGERLNLTQVANIFRLPPSWLGAEVQPNTTSEQEFLRLYLALLPRIRRIEAALRADPDLFPERDLYPQLDTAELVRTDAKTAAEVEHMQVQDGTLLADEARARRGMEPLPPIPDDPTQRPGMVPQLTPVGGQANPGAAAAAPPPPPVGA